MATGGGASGTGNSGRAEQSPSPTLSPRSVSPGDVTPSQSPLRGTVLTGSGDAGNQSPVGAKSFSKMLSSMRKQSPARGSGSGGAPVLSASAIDAAVDDAAVLLVSPHAHGDGTGDDDGKAFAASATPGKAFAVSATPGKVAAAVDPDPAPATGRPLAGGADMAVLLVDYSPGVDSGNKAPVVVRDGSTAQASTRGGVGTGRPGEDAQAALAAVAAHRSGGGNGQAPRGGDSSTSSRSHSNGDGGDGDDVDEECLDLDDASDVSSGDGHGKAAPTAAETNGGASESESESESESGSRPVVATTVDAVRVYRRRDPLSPTQAPTVPSTAAAAGSASESSLQGIVLHSRHSSADFSGVVEHLDGDGGSGTDSDAQPSGGAARAAAASRAMSQLDVTTDAVCVPPSVSAVDGGDHGEPSRELTVPASPELQSVSGVASLHVSPLSQASAALSGDDGDDADGGSRVRGSHPHSRHGHDGDSDGDVDDDVPAAHVSSAALMAAKGAKGAHVGDRRGSTSTTGSAQADAAGAVEAPLSALSVLTATTSSRHFGAARADAPVATPTFTDSLRSDSSRSGRVSAGSNSRTLRRGVHTRTHTPAHTHTPRAAAFI